MKRTTRAVRRTAEFVDDFSPIILLLASPLFLFPTPARAPTLLLVPALWLVARLAGRQPLPRTPLDGAFFLLVLMICVSLYATPDIVFSLPKIVGLLFGIILFYAVIRTLNEPRKLYWAIQLFILGGAGLSVIALLGTNWLDKVPILGSITKHLPRVIRGVAGAEDGFHPNAVGGALVLFIPLQLVLLLTYFQRQEDRFGFSSNLKHMSLAQALTRPSGTLSHSEWERAGVRALSILCVPFQLSESWLFRSNSFRWFLFSHTVLLVLTGGTLVLTQSRGAWLGLTLALVALLAWHSSRSRKLLVILLLLGAVAALWIGPKQLQSIASKQVGSNMEANVVGRLEVWSRAIYAIQDFPFTGMGMNVFRKAMPILYPSFLTAPDFDVAHAHNHLLQAALDLGLPGLIAYLALWSLTVYMLVAVYRLSATPWLRSMAVGLGLGLMAHFVFGISDAIPLGAKVGVFFWLDLALVVALFKLVYSQAHGARSSETPDSCD